MEEMMQELKKILGEEAYNEFINSLYARLFSENKRNPEMVRKAIGLAANLLLPEATSEAMEERERLLRALTA